jgi:hypothetical protein
MTLTRRSHHGLRAGLMDRRFSGERLGIEASASGKRGADIQ